MISLGLADWISDRAPDYRSFKKCKILIKTKTKTHRYEITKKDEEDIQIFLNIFQLVNNE
tara:strand:- start:11862 stop:12041 length:180 start_codon:yes stop_codon:yes gene_type:complete